MPKQAKKSVETTPVVINVVDPSSVDLNKSMTENKPKAKSAADLLAGLASKGTTQKKATATKERLIMTISETGEDLYRRFAPAKQLLDVVEAEVEAVKGELNVELFDSWTQLCWDHKNQPANPAIQVRNADGKIDCEGMFVVTERISVQIPDPANPAESVATLLVEMGVDKAKAESLVNSEVSFTPVLSLRPFMELIEGHYGKDRQFVEATPTEKAVGEKILKLLTENLDDDEKALVLVNVPKTVVKKGFLQRVATYANAKSQLASIFKVFVPVVQNRNAKFAVSDTPVEQTNRLVSFAKKLLGEKLA